MIKVFLVEDEVVIRNGIKNSILWEKEGFIFSGEASDGELAYPLILKEKPDILITDIKMPFMDGLELSQAIKKELPDIKIMILSGYNDFDYAKRAIGIGITDYLLKPISADKLLEAIREVSKTIEKEREEKELLARYLEEMQENTERDKLNLFTRLITEQMPLTEALEEGRKLGMELSAGAYNVLLFKIIEDEEVDSDRSLAAFMNIENYAEQRVGVYHFWRGVSGWAFLCTAENVAELETMTSHLIDDLKLLMQPFESMLYFGGIGKAVERLRELKDCFREADEAFASRFVAHSNQIVSIQDVQLKHQKDEPAVQGIGSMEQNRALIEKFLRNGTEEELPSFIHAYFAEIPEDNLKSLMLRQYIAMDVYVSLAAFGERMKITQEEIVKECGEIRGISEYLSDEESTKEYVKEMLQKMLVLRDKHSGRRYSDLILTAQRYIEENYMTEEISLNTVSSIVNMSPSYFSSIFSQEVGKTFVEYLTEIRMEKAKELLMCSSMRTSEIGFEIGYKDAHYFSYIFKKTQQCTPKEYRARGKKVE